MKYGQDLCGWRITNLGRIERVEWNVLALADFRKFYQAGIRLVETESIQGAGERRFFLLWKMRRRESVPFERFCPGGDISKMKVLREVRADCQRTSKKWMYNFVRIDGGSFGNV